MDFNKDHPRVFFPSDSPGDTKTVGFLFLVDGEAWAAKTPEDAKARFPAIQFAAPSWPRWHSAGRPQIFARARLPGRNHQIAPPLEVTGNHAVRRQKPL